MYAIMGVTGQIGGVVARTLLAAGQPVRAVVARCDQRAGLVGLRVRSGVGQPIEDRAALVAAFREAEGVFVLVPPNFDPAPEFPEAQAIGETLRAALVEAKSGANCLPQTIGAQAKESICCDQHTIIARRPSVGLPIPVTFLRPAWFLWKTRWDVAPAMHESVIPSFLQPLDKPVPMVATADIGRVAAGLLQEGWSGRRVVELEGPRRVTPNEIAATFAKLLGRPVRMEAVPRESWEDLFRSQGMKNPIPRIRMLDGFNEGWIDFEGGEAGSQKGSVALESVLKALITRGH